MVKIYVLEQKKKNIFSNKYFESMKEIIKNCKEQLKLRLNIHPLTGAIFNTKSSLEYEESEVIEYKLIEIKRTKIKDIPEMKKLHYRWYGEEE